MQFFERLNSSYQKIIMLNKRIAQRYRMPVPVKYYVRGSQAVCNAVSCEDISSGGIGFSDGRFIPPATNIMLELTLAKRTVSSVGRIAWVSVSSRSSRYRLGVEFIEMNPVDREYLRKYISSSSVPEEQ